MDSVDIGGDGMKLNRLQVTLDKGMHSKLGTTVHIQVTRADDPKDLHVQRLVPDNDFESHWDYVWDACKRLLDDELKAIGLME